MLTKRQSQLLNFIRDYVSYHGFAPTLAEMADAMRLKSLATVHKHLENLRAKKLIARHWNRSRALTLLDGVCPTCGLAPLSLSSIQTEAKEVESAATLDGPHQRGNADTTLTAPSAREALRHG